MNKNKYPRIGQTTKLKKVPMCKCGEVAKHRITVQVNNFRGDDDTYYACDSHRRDLGFLIVQQKISQRC